jgi:hydrogenase-4 component B
MTGATCVVGLALLLAGTCLAGFAPTLRTGLLLQAGGTTAIGAAGGAVLWRGHAVGSAFGNGIHPGLGIDRLSGVFLLTVGIVGGPVLIFASGYLDAAARSRAVAVLTGVFVAMLVALLCARDVVTFLMAWELMTLVPAAIILIWRVEHEARRSVFVYVAVTHLAGAGVWVALLVLAEHGALGGHPLDASSAAGALVAISALIGFAAKAGAMPLHVWLPRAHPLAPAHVSALMSGVMIKVALYGLMRVLLDWLATPPLWIGIVVVVIGAASALGGIVYALFQHELKRLLAFSSIENAGIILLGLGAALVLRREGAQGWAGIALAAALLHTINHAVFKSLLFLGAGAFDRAVHGLELDRLGGLLRRMPWTGWTTLIGCAAIAGLAPLNGFVSEWLTLQALFQLTLTGSVTAGVTGVLALGALALTAAFGVYCFVKVAGLVLLGRARRPACAHAVEAPRAMRAGLLLLAGWCVVLGAVPGRLAAKLAELMPGAAPFAGGVRIHPPGTGGIPTLALAAAIVVLVAGLRLLRGRRVAAPAPTWASGQVVEPSLDWTSAGFTKPIRLVLDLFLRSEREVSVVRAGGVVQAVTYRGRVPLLVEERLYAPLAAVALRAAALIRPLVQSGKLGAYAVSLGGMLLVLLACARLGFLG